MTLNRILPVIVLCGAFAATAAAATIDANIGTTPVRLVTPVDFCQVQRSDPGEAKLLDTVSAAIPNILLAMSVDCRQLAAWHAGKPPGLQDISQYQIPKNPVATLVSGDPRAWIAAQCADLRTHGAQYFAEETPASKKRVEDAIKGMQYHGVVDLGVLRQDDAACYYGAVQNYTTAEGRNVNQLVVAAVAVIKGRSVIHYMFTPYAGTASITSTLDRDAATIADLMANNR